MDSRITSTRLPSKPSRDHGDSPATNPPSNEEDMAIRNVPTTTTMMMTTAGEGVDSTHHRRAAAAVAARRTKRAATREKMGRPAIGPAMTSSSPNSSSNAMREYDDDDHDIDDDDDEHDDVDIETPGCFAVAGPAQRLAKMNGIWDPTFSETDNIAENTIVPDNDNDNADTFHRTRDTKSSSGLPVAYKAELVVVDTDVQVASPVVGMESTVEKMDSRSNNRSDLLPFKWFMIGGCIFLIIVVIALGVTLGLVLGKGNNNDRSPSEQSKAGPTFPPMVQPTFSPMIQPTYQPMVQPTFAPVEPGRPTFAPVDSPTWSPTLMFLTPSPTVLSSTTIPPTAEEEDGTDPPTTTPISPTMKPVTPTNAPVTPTIEPATSTTVP